MGNIVQDNEQNSKLCPCPGCPTYKKSKFTDNVFCARGKAAQKINSSGCLCPGCKVYRQFGLDQMYYCKEGKSAEI